MFSLSLKNWTRSFWCSEETSFTFFLAEASSKQSEGNQLYSVTTEVNSRSVALLNANVYLQHSYDSGRYFMGTHFPPKLSLRYYHKIAPVYHLNIHGGFNMRNVSAREVNAEYIYSSLYFLSKLVFWNVFH